MKTKKSNTGSTLYTHAECVYRRFQISQHDLRGTDTYCRFELTAATHNSSLNMYKHSHFVHVNHSFNNKTGKININQDVSICVLPNN